MGSWARCAARAAWAVACALAFGGCGIEGRPIDGVKATSAPKAAAPEPAIDPRFAEALAPLPPMPRAGEAITFGDGRVDIYPPLDPDLERAPLVAYLHGACGDPRDCAWIQAAGRGKSFLACTAGNARCGDGFDWVGPTKERTATVDAALAAVDQALGARVDHQRGDVLIGYSRGAYLARDLLAVRPGVFRGVVYIGAEIKPDAAGLRAAGIKRVVLGCGDYDGAVKQMRSTAAMLSAQGIPARFVSFGRMGHGWPNDIDAILTRAIAWIREDPSFGS